MLRPFCAETRLPIQSKLLPASLPGDPLMKISFLLSVSLWPARWPRHKLPKHPSKGPDMVISARALQIHNSAIIVDTHADTPQRFLDEGFDIGSTDPNDIGHISLDKARRGNLGAEFFSIWVDPETNQGHFRAAHVRPD